MAKSKGLPKMGGLPSAKRTRQDPSGRFMPGLVRIVPKRFSVVPLPSTPTVKPIRVGSSGVAGPKGVAAFFSTGVGSQLPENQAGEGGSAIAQAAFGTGETLPIPPWLPRTAPPNPGGPWTVAFRIWKPGTYAGEGIVAEPRVDFRFVDGHEHAYEVNHNVLRAAMADPTGKFVHRVLLGKGWNNKNKQSRYRNWPLN